MNWISGSQHLIFGDPYNTLCQGKIHSLLVICKTGKQLKRLFSGDSKLVGDPWSKFDHPDS